MRFEKYTLLRSFASYIEIMKTENTKGHAAKLLKEKLGAKILVGMGDYENDIPLFREVDVSYAVGNAVPELKEIATKTVAETVNGGAAAAIIRDIEESLKV
jgi:hydroxymethylpyrimidine pyrophosphatase-like HAD family hydrolase